MTETLRCVSVADRFARLPTAAKLLLILAPSLLPIGIALTWLGEHGIRQANDALRGRSAGPGAGRRTQAIESLIARNALALRIAANGALAAGASGNAVRARPTVARHRSRRRPALRARNGRRKPLCARRRHRRHRRGCRSSRPATSGCGSRPTPTAIVFRTGVNGGMATGELRPRRAARCRRECGGAIEFDDPARRRSRASGIAPPAGRTSA